MHNKLLWKLNGLLIILLSSACGYSVSVNERVVYTPPSVFTDYKIADQFLARCVAQTLQDESVHYAKDLIRLNCSSAGIKSLAGLDVFSGLQEINLAHNTLRAVTELARLPQLQVVILRDNQLQDAAPLLSLLKLRVLDLGDNEQLPCADIEQLEKEWEPLATGLIKPAQCR
jgi:hypothetical protein